MPAPARTPEGLVWPPVAGSSAPVDETPTRIIAPFVATGDVRTDTVVAGATRAELVTSLTDEHQATGGLGLGALLAEVKGDILADQNYASSMTVGISRGLHGESAEAATRQRRPNAVVHDEAYVLARAERERALLVGAGSTALGDTAPAADSRAPRGGRTLASSFMHRARPVVEAEPVAAPEAAPVDPRFAVQKAMYDTRRALRKGADETTAAAAEVPTEVFAAPLVAPLQVVHEGVARAVRSETAGRHRMRSEGLFMRFMHSLRIPSWGRGRHVR